MAEFVALGKNLRISPRKLQLVAKNFRGAKAEEAYQSLKFVHRKAALPLGKVLKSAISNAKNNFEVNSDKLVIKEIIVGQGPTLKRIRPASRGMAHRILKRTTNIKVVLEEAK